MIVYSFMQAIGMLIIDNKLKLTKCCRPKLYFIYSCIDNVADI
ncbi:DNA-3-methyladenine glycosylase I [Clostridium sp. MT-14]|uniref:DNA-3-methyladenine glycosylase I n=1 Tax=Clostridium aromativorans TaxID=2836848 RepID=A0ABS8N146_9CLOT|nr:MULTISPECIES: DNA-3-methyladenine glycosylase I [Clostridium]MCC9293522.1 DNA-3-methyladenine glycosylase I [Clostridium aromativorans]CAB1252952.1 hypothetical protein CLOSBL3_12561 [Clostridiaceae bacterium BL-3]